VASSCAACTAYHDLDELAKEGDLDGAGELVDAIESAFVAARDALSREVAAAEARA
jgi:hypothetical protein